MTGPEIIDRGNGPKIAGTRITVYTVLEYMRSGRTRDWIAAMLNLSSSQVQVAMDYIQEHSDAVNAEYDRIMTRIRQGNPPRVERQLQANRDKVKARLSQKPGAFPFGVQVGYRRILLPLPRVAPRQEWEYLGKQQCAIVWRPSFSSGQRADLREPSP